MMLLIMGLLAVGLAYVLGTVPFGLLLTRAAGHGDIRAIGSGNIGATNVLRTGNKKLAAATLLCDALKGLLAVWLLPELVFMVPTSTADQSAILPLWHDMLEALCAAAALLGHIFPVWLKFKGGKGVATFLGAVLALQPLLGMVFAATWLGVFKPTRISSLSALTALVMTSLCSLILVLLFPPHLLQSAQDVMDHRMGIQTLCASLFALGGSALLFHTHRANIARLRDGTEPRFGRPKPVPEDDTTDEEGAAANA